MRRRTEHEGNSDGAGHIKVRIIDFEMDGANATLEEGIRALTTALSKSPVTTTVVPPQRAITATATPTKPIATTTVADPEPLAEPDGGATELPEEETPLARPKRTQAAPRTPDVLSDIDFKTGNVSLKDFVAQKNPSDHYEKFATIAVWYKENHDLDEVTDDRIYSAYKFLGWVSPNDVGQRLRNLKANKKWFDKGDNRGGYKINIVGQNQVDSNFQ